MKEFVEWLEKEKNLYPVKLAAAAHYGNVRTARLLMNLILMMNGFPLSYY